MNIPNNLIRLEKLYSYGRTKFIFKIGIVGFGLLYFIFFSILEYQSIQTLWVDRLPVILIKAIISGVLMGIAMWMVIEVNYKRMNLTHKKDGEEKPLSNKPS